MVEETENWAGFESDEDVDSQTVRARVEGALRDVVRRTINQGSGAKAVTEDVIRALVSEMKLPKEVAAQLLTNADTIKNEVVRVIANEVRRFLESANLGEEMAKILTSISFEVRTEVRFIPNEDAVRPSVRSRVGVKSTRGDEEKVLHEGESSEFDQAIRAGITEFIQRMLTRGGASAVSEPATSSGRPRQQQNEEPAPDEEAPETGYATDSMQTSAARRQQLRRALARRRDRRDD